MLTAILAVGPAACRANSGDAGPRGTGGGSGTDAGGGDAKSVEDADSGAENPIFGWGNQVIDHKDEARLGTAWHPDPDGDGIEGSDNCSLVYNPDQDDSDSDGAGDACANIGPSSEGGPVVDLRAEHVTPYGGWFTFTSSTTASDGKLMMLLWTTDRAELDTIEGHQALRSRGQGPIMRIYARHGEPAEVPFVISNMNPQTPYWVTVRRVDNPLEPGIAIPITTSPTPTLQLAPSRPRVWATQEVLATLRQRATAGDSAFERWRDQIGKEAVRVEGTTIDEMKMCSSAALLYAATGEQQYLLAARKLFDGLVRYWQDRELRANGYRWASAALPLCTDLLWDELAEDERNTAVRAYLEDDESLMVDPESKRLENTDEFSALTRGFILGGLNSCDAAGLDPALAARGCEVLRDGLQRWYGVELVKMRRDKTYFAQSDGHLPDGIDYGQGSSKYAMETFWALSNAGISPAEYAPFIRNNLFAFLAHPLTPQMKGFASWGDVAGYLVNFNAEPNSFPVRDFHADLPAMHMGLLRASGMHTEASWARWSLYNVFGSAHRAKGDFLILFDTDEIDPEDYRNVLPTAFWGSGVGRFYDRTGWSVQDSQMVVHAGWSGVDHSQEEHGHFQLYRDGNWITHESLAYEGPGRTVEGHNVPLLDISFDSAAARAGQYTHSAPGGKTGIYRVSTADDYTYALADLTAHYRSSRYGRLDYGSVQRSLIWWKGGPGQAESVIVYDRVVSAAGEVPQPQSRRWQLHFSSAPALAPGSARVPVHGVTGPQEAIVTSLFPSATQLSVLAPQGDPGGYPEQVYTYRLIGDPGPLEPATEWAFALQARSVGQPVAAPELISTGQYLGARVGTDVVLFSRADLSEFSGAASASAVLQSFSHGQVFWTGLVPHGSYKVAASRELSAIALSVEVGGSHRANRAGVLRLLIPEEDAGP